MSIRPIPREDGTYTLNVTADELDALTKGLVMLNRQRAASRNTFIKKKLADGGDLQNTRTRATYRDYTIAPAVPYQE